MSLRSNMRPRKERRTREREAKKLAQAREKLAAIERGGASDRPIEIESASVIEVGAKAMHCLRCDTSPMRLEEHAAVERDGRSLRVARLSCVRCGARREVWFRIVSPLAS